MPLLGQYFDRSLCDIIIPICNNLTYVTDCLLSLFAHTPENLYRLIVIDDGSDAFTRQRLHALLFSRANVSVHRNQENLGFVKSCNKGMMMGDAPFIVLLNSDVVVPPEWLERLLICAASDNRIASVNPLTNYASQISIPMPPGTDFIALDSWLSRTRAGKISDVVTGVGFCMLLRRSALQVVGFFDERYGRGYCEDSDLCMRLTSHGYRTVVAENVFVYHKGRASFQDRDQRYRENRRIFDQLWATEYSRQYRAFLQTNPLREVREALRGPLRPDPIPTIWKTARTILEAWRNKDLKSLGRGIIRGIRELPAAKREVVRSHWNSRFFRPEATKVTYVLHNLVVAGGVLSVIQIVNELILMGIEAKIAALFEDPAVYDWTRMYGRPMIFRNFEELVSELPPTDIAVATLWTTAEPVRELVLQGRAKEGVYFLQDYEPWFFPESDRPSREKVLQTYKCFRHHIVKSDWLAHMLARHGCRPRKIRLGMDLSMFYPRDILRQRPKVLAMARPRTRRRGFPRLVKALSMLHRARPDVEIVLFGDRFLSSYGLPFPYRDEGIVVNQNRLAHIYSEADVFLDASDFQGFGRCALEAMACGTACVLTEVGGVSEYARHGENCLLVRPGEPSGMVEAILYLLEHDSLREKIATEGIRTAQDYCHKREARETAAFFLEILGKQ
ncbi:MAG: glycosyltransferase [Desulfosoma sp.]